MVTRWFYAQGMFWKALKSTFLPFFQQVRYNSAIFTGSSVVVVPGYPTRDVQKFQWTGESFDNPELLMKQETYDVQYPLVFSLPHVTCPKQP